MDNRPPDIKCEIWLVPHGYESKMTLADGMEFGQARDFRESLNPQTMTGLLYFYLKEIIDNMESLYRNNPHITEQYERR